MIEFIKTELGFCNTDGEYVFIENNGLYCELDGCFDIEDLEQILAKMKELKNND